MIKLKVRSDSDEVRRRPKYPRRDIRVIDTLSCELVLRPKIVFSTNIKNVVLLKNNTSMADFSSQFHSRCRSAGATIALTPIQTSTGAVR